MDAKIKIEKNVPLIPMNTVWPFAEMEVGDSFAVPAAELSRVRNAASGYAIRHGMKFSIRARDGKHRCWRTA